MNQKTGEKNKETVQKVQKKQVNKYKKIVGNIKLIQCNDETNFREDFKTENESSCLMCKGNSFQNDWNK